MDEADDDLDALLAAVPASPATDADSDEDLAMLLDLVAAGESSADRYRQRAPSCAAWCGAAGRYWHT